jgi:hypothetical protein
MGSSTSKPRKGHDHPQHLPKVGSPANEEWEHETHRSVVFGSMTRTVIIGVVLIATVVGLLILTA